MTESWSASSYRRRPETSGRRSDPWITWGIRPSLAGARGGPDGRSARFVGTFRPVAPGPRGPTLPRPTPSWEVSLGSYAPLTAGARMPRSPRYDRLTPGDCRLLHEASLVHPGADRRRAPRCRGRRAPARRGRPGGRRRTGPRAGIAGRLGAVGRRAAIRHPPRPVRHAAPRARGRQRLLRARVGLPQHRRPPHGRAAPRGPAGHPRRADAGGRPPEHGLRDVHVPAVGRGARRWRTASRWRSCSATRPSRSSWSPTTWTRCSMRSRWRRPSPAAPTPCASARRSPCTSTSPAAWSTTATRCASC